MKRGDQDHLLKEILTGDELSEFRQVSLETGLAALRQEAARRHRRRASLLACLPLCLAVAFLLRQSTHPTIRPTEASRPSGAATGPTQPGLPDIRFINDEQLLALFPGRAVALIGRPGEQQLVFLDEPAAGLHE